MIKQTELKQLLKDNNIPTKEIQKLLDKKQATICNYLNCKIKMKKEDLELIEIKYKLISKEKRKDLELKKYCYELITDLGELTAKFEELKTKTTDFFELIKK